MDWPPLVRRLIEELGYPVVDEHGLAGFLDAHPVSVLFFSEDEKKYPETSDVAVVLPELVKHFDGRIAPAIVDPRAAPALQELYGFRQWPALVFLRGDAYLGAICRIQDWQDYLERIEELLQARPSRPPGIGIPVVGA